MVFIRWLVKPSVLRMIIITIGISILVREAARPAQESTLFVKAQRRAGLDRDAAELVRGDDGDRQGAVLVPAERRAAREARPALEVVDRQRALGEVAVRVEVDETLARKWSGYPPVK